jgi:alcohol dehydrogenase class IV
MPAVMEFNLPVAGDKYAVAAKALGVGVEGKELVAWFRTLAKGVGMEKPAEFGEHQRTDEEEDLIVGQTLASGSTKHNPRTADEADVRTMLAEVLGGC